MPKTLYLMRHAETLFNVQNKSQGWCDSPVTARGVEQARLTGLEFASRGISFDHAYCSTAERSSDTLEIATEAAFGAPMPYERMKDLREISFGIFEGQDNFLERHDETFSSFYVPYGGEDHKEAAKRLTRGLTTIMERPGHNCVLAVSHGGVAINFYQLWSEHARVPVSIFANCLVYVYEYENGIFSCAEIFVADLSSLEQPGLPQQVRRLKKEWGK